MKQVSNETTDQFKQEKCPNIQTYFNQSGSVAIIITIMIKCLETMNKSQLW